MTNFSRLIIKHKQDEWMPQPSSTFSSYSKHENLRVSTICFFNRNLDAQFQHGNHFSACYTDYQRNSSDRISHSHHHQRACKFHKNIFPYIHHSWYKLVEPGNSSQYKHRNIVNYRITWENKKGKIKTTEKSENKPPVSNIFLFCHIFYIRLNLFSILEHEPIKLFPKRTIQIQKLKHNNPPLAQSHRVNISPKRRKERVFRNSDYQVK